MYEHPRVRLSPQHCHYCHTLSEANALAHQDTASDSIRTSAWTQTMARVHQSSGSRFIIILPCTQWPLLWTECAFVDPMIGHYVRMLMDAVGCWMLLAVGITILLWTQEPPIPETNTETMPELIKTASLICDIPCK